MLSTLLDPLFKANIQSDVSLKTETTEFLNELINYPIIKQEYDRIHESIQSMEEKENEIRYES